MSMFNNKVPVKLVDGRYVPCKPGEQDEILDRGRVYFSFKPSRCDPAYAAESDINVIVSRFMKTGELPNRVSDPVFGDVTTVPVGTDALLAVRRAQVTFEKLPISLRRELEHDFRNFPNWLADPANKDRAIKWGLLKAKAPDDAPVPKGKGRSGASGAAPGPADKAGEKPAGDVQT